MNELEKCAQILVECGYANIMRGGNDKITGCEYWIGNVINNIPVQIPVQIFADTIEGRRQADAIEDYIRFNHDQTWRNSRFVLNVPDSSDSSNHQWRLDRIKYCIKDLIK